MNRFQPISVWILLFPLISFAQTPPGESTRLSLQRIYGSREFASRRFSARWRADRDSYTQLITTKQGDQELIEVEAMTGKRIVILKSKDLVPSLWIKTLRIEGYSFSPDRKRILIYTNSQRVWRRRSRGDYLLFDLTSRKVRKLGPASAQASLQFAKFSPDGKHVAYVLDRNIYIERATVSSPQRRRLTTTPTRHIINGTFDWVYEEELGLRDGFRWRPDGRAIAYWQLDTSGVSEFTLINNTNRLYPRTRVFAYPKVGQRNSSCRVGVVDIKTGQTKWVRVPGDARNHYIARMEFVGSAGELAIQQLNRLQNTNRLMLADAGFQKVRTILTERDPAWVDVDDETVWLTGAKRFTWISERNGWRHVLLCSRDGQQRLVTPGKFDVIRLLHVNERLQRIFFIASPHHAAQRYLYSTTFAGRDLHRHTPKEQSGSHSYRISQTGRFAFHTWSSFDVPPQTELIALPSHRSIRVLEANRQLRDRVSKLRRSPAEFFQVDIGNEIKLDAYCIKPPQMLPGKKYPLLVYVYGEPAGQTVRDRWGGSSYLWHTMLAQQGYVVMSFDNRGTRSPRGREFRKCVYRKIGILAPREQAAAVKSVLQQRDYLDENRVGIWGWSGGGSSSLQAIFKYPQLYHTAIAIAPVPNQLYYDTIYQERYMGLPQDNVSGFKNGSAINFAHQLKGNLLLVHGTGDDNCHYQTTELLINKLIEHNKQFTMFAYPNRSHSIREGKNTTRHLRTLMTNYLRAHLPPGPK